MKKIVSLFLSIAMVLGMMTTVSLSAFALSSSGTTTDGFTYEQIGNNMTITGHTNPVGELDFPEMVGGYYVDAIAPEAFKGCDELTGVSIPHLYVMGDRAFKDCTSLENIYFDGAMVYDFGADVFTNTAYYNNHDNWYDDVALYVCDYLVKVDEGTMGNFEVYEGCWGIAAEAFKGTGVNEVTIPTTLTAIGSDAFKDTPLSHLYINMTEWMWQNVYIGYPNEELMSAAQQAYPNDFECDHSNADSTYNEPTCTIGGYVLYNCMDCGQSWEDNYEAPLGHNYANLGPNYANQRCTVCGVEDNGHRCDFEVRVYPANCIRRGYTEYVCSCGIEYKMDLVWPYGHEYENGICTRCGASGNLFCEHSSLMQNIVEPDCLKGGYTYYTCFDCGEYIFESNFTEPLGHNFIKGSCTRCGELSDHVCSYVENIVEPDCTNAGYTEYVCSCGNSYILDDSYVAARGHDFFEGRCGSCGEYDPNYEGHVCEYEEKVVDPTCSEMGYTEMVCSCGNSYILDNSYIQKFPHSVGASGYCSGCGVGIETPHPYESNSDIHWEIGSNDATSIMLQFSPDCLMEGGCDYLYIYNANGNQIGVYTGDQLASKKLRFEGSYIRIRFQSDGSVEEYGFSLDDFKIITADNDCQHANVETENQVEAGCGDGYTGDRVCLDCGAIISKGNKIPGTGHDMQGAVCQNCNGAYNYTSREDGLYITEFSNPVGVLEIPSEIDGKTVVGISDYAFNGQNGITGVIIPDTVTNIDFYAFNYCRNIEFVSIPDSVEYIGERAFGSNESLKEITLPDGVELAYSAFSECRGLETVRFEGAAKVGQSAFVACDSIKKIYAPSLDDWFSVEFEDASSSPAYSGASLYIGGETLEELVIPEGTEEISDFAFYGNKNITSVYIPSSVKKIGNYAFAYCENLKSVTISNGVEIIDEGAFINCPIDKLYIPSSVKKVGIIAFRDCYNLSSLELSEGLETIGVSAFSNCGIETLNIPDSVEKIESFAFSDNMNLYEVTGGNGLKEVGHCAFESTYYIHNVDNDQDGCIYLGSALIRFTGDTQYSTVTVKDGTACIAGGAFRNYHYINEIIIPDSVESIGAYAFADSSPAKINLPDSVRYIGDYAFANCYNLTEIVLPKYLSKISDGLFANCERITSIVIPEGVKTIGIEAFYSCDSLENVSLPDSVTSIGERAFDRSAISNNEENWTDDVLYIGKHLIECRDYVTEHTVKDGTLTIAAYAFADGCIGKITLPEGLRTIGEFAFSNCYNLTEVVIPEGVKDIGEHAFSSCSALQTVTFPLSLKHIGEYAFAWNSMQSIYYNGIKEEWELIDIEEGNYSLTEGATFYFAGEEEQHVHSFYESSWQEAGCVFMGYIEYACDCGFTYKGNVTPALGHNLTVSYVHDATCMDRGWTEYWCDRCQNSYIMDYTDKIPHNYVEESRTENGCDDINTISYRCTMCGNYREDVIAPTGHDFVTETVEANCTQIGYTTYKCKDCELEYVSDYVSALGHDFVTEVVEPTCQTGGHYHKYCTKCDYDKTYGYSEATGHDYEVSIKKATCTEAGCTTHTCKYCGYSYVTDETEALGHNYQTVVTEPTCTEQGYTTSGCVNGCGDKQISDYTPALGHNYIAEVTDPDCINAGYTTYTCSRCDDSYIADEKDSLGHNYESFVTAPTCVKGGFTTHTCERCGDSYVSDETYPIGHEYVKTVIEPTCTEGGYTITECKNGCGYYKTSDYTGPAHDCDYVVTPPTCTEDGFTTCTCKNCGYTYTTGETSALGHDYEEIVTDPTCTEGGFTTHTCERCGDTYQDNATSPMGHKYSSTVTDPDCTNGGYTTHNCVLCGYSYKDSETEKLGHSYNYVVIAPTETEQGYTLHTCARCGDSYKDNFTDPVANVKKVQGVKAEASDIDITVTWESYEGADRYYVRAIKPDGTVLTTKTITDGSNKCVFTGLEYDVEYKFIVYARLADKTYLLPEEADEVTATMKILDRVVGITSSVSGRTITVNWLAFPGADRYYVMVYPKGADPTNSKNRITTVNAGNKTTVNIINAVSPETPYDIYVSARVGGSYQALDNALYTQATIPVTAPATFEIVGVTPNTIRIKWAAVKNADKYYVRVKNAKGTVLKTLTTDKAYVNITGLAESTTYNVEIQARVPSGSKFVYSGYGDPLPITTSAFGTIGFAASSSNGRVTLSWNRIANASQYYIYEVVNGEKTRLATIKTPATTAVTFDAKKGTHTYGIIIKVVNNSASCSTELVTKTVTVK